MPAVIVNELYHEPGCCFRCRATTLPQIDTGAELEPDAGHPQALYLCPECVGEFARLLGYMAPEQSSSRIAALEAEAEALREQLAEARLDGAVADVANRLLLNELDRASIGAEVEEMRAALERRRDAIAAEPVVDAEPRPARARRGKELAA